MNSFKEMGLNPIIQASLDKLTFTTPTPIQAQTIPLTLAGKDVLGSAQTGTGKTLAFTIPLITRLLENESETALVIVPTRELAQQVAHMVRQLLGPKSALKTALLIGGESFIKQLGQLRNRETRIFIGTPGRIIDHISRSTIRTNATHFLVLDETDRMLDMGFESQIDQIVKQLPQDHQTVMFSATIPSNILKTASRFLKNPERIAIGKESSPVSKIKQEVIFVADNEKETTLIKQLEERKESIIVFVKTKWSSENLAHKLNDAGFKAIALHGDLRQNKRERVITAFRKATYPILVATDIAARGIDIASVRHIINFDLPQNPEDYIHRIGRTGRAGAEGFSLCLVTNKEKRNWMIIDRFANSSQGISDSDRAQLSERPARRSGGGRSGGFGGRSGGNRDRRGGGGFSRGRNDRRSDSGFGGGDRRERGPRRSFDRDGSEGSERPERSERTFDRKPRSFDRPFSDRRSDSSDRPFFKRDRQDGNAESSERRPRKPFSSDRDSNFTPREDRGGDFKSRSNFRSNDKPFFKRDGDFKKRSSDSSFSGPRKPFRQRDQE